MCRLPIATCLLILGFALPAARADGIHVDACSVYAVPGARPIFDCRSQAAKLDEDRDAWEVPIGANLAPGLRITGPSKVKIDYSCGIAHGEAGPNELDDH